MKFTTRLVLLVTVLTVGATLVTAALLTWTTRRAIITEAEASGEKVARLLARSASLAASIPTEVEGIIAEAQEIMEEFKGSPALDAGLLAVAQAVEHYEIARYGTLKAWAAQLGLADAERLLDQTLQEETATDEILTGLAETVINAAAQG